HLHRAAGEIDPRLLHTVHGGEAAFNGVDAGGAIGVGNGKGDAAGAVFQPFDEFDQLRCCPADAGRHIDRKVGHGTVTRRSNSTGPSVVSAEVTTTSQ